MRLVYVPNRNKKREYLVLATTDMYVDYYNAFQTREVPIAAAKILKAAGAAPAILDHPAITTGELLDTDLDAWLDGAKRNVEALKAAGAKKVILVNPHV